MRVSQIMTPEPLSVSLATPVSVVAGAMRDGGVGALPVIDGGRLVGMVTDRDVTVRWVPEAPSAARVPVETVMTVGMRHCIVDQTVEAAAAIMGDNQLRRLPVLDRAGCFVGMVSLGDIAEHASERLAGEALGEIVERR
ncbi:CBS domain-containing protein [Roseovarius salinarum]|uniref:CBS domain-containing protein n=1 Tax=Roseovarius salinarum TaxID=1981892 RepID=UPI0013000EAD|nr:CBS domain-containing protein [Roseovarius salinarum]